MGAPTLRSVEGHGPLFEEGDPLNSIVKTLADADAPPPVTRVGDLDFPLALRPGVLATESPDDPDLALPGPVGSLKP